MNKKSQKLAKRAEEAGEKHPSAFTVWILRSQEKLKTWIKSSACYFTVITPHSDMMQLATQILKCRRAHYQAVYMQIYHIWNYLYSTSHLRRGRGTLVFFMQQQSCLNLTLGRSLKRSNRVKIYWTFHISDCNRQIENPVVLRKPYRIPNNHFSLK